MRNADTKIAEYQQALDKARAGIYDENARVVQALTAEQNNRAQTIKTEMEQKVATAKAAIAQDSNEARAMLQAQSEMLASQIADAILQKKVA